MCYNRRVSERILVIGGTGLVGNALVRTWQKRGAKVVGATYHCHPGEHFRKLDMQDARAVAELLAEVKPRLVAVPAANPHVDYCELNPQETRRTNVSGTINVARACQAAGVRMIFFSSDYVFDGEQGLYKETDKPCPINEYGRQKAEAEAAVLALNAANLVIRTSGAYGWQWEQKNFVLQIINKLRLGQAIKVVSDIRYNPTYVENLAEVTADLAAGSGGIFHVVGADTVARVEFARRAARVFGLDESLIEGVSSLEFKSPTPRPKESGLNTDKAGAAARTPLWGVDQGLAHMRKTENEWAAYAKGRFFKGGGA